MATALLRYGDLTISLSWLTGRQLFSAVLTAVGSYWIGPCDVAARSEVDYAENPSVLPSGKANEINEP